MIQHRTMKNVSRLFYVPMTLHPVLLLLYLYLRFQSDSAVLTQIKLIKMPCEK
jgi:hypothetical protein